MSSICFFTTSTTCVVLYVFCKAVLSRDFGHATRGFPALFSEAILHAKVTPMILGGDHAITAPVCAALAVLQTPVATRLELYEHMITYEYI